MKTNFFTIESALKKGEIRLQSKVKYDTLRILDNKTVLKKVNYFKIEKGSKYFDILTFSDSFFFAISEKFKLLLESNKINGLSTFPINIENSQEKYYGVICYGKAGEITNLRALNDYETDHAEFDINTWDGSDIFNLNKSLLLVCTEKVKKLIEKSKISNIEFNPL